MPSEILLLCLTVLALDILLPDAVNTTYLLGAPPIELFFPEILEFRGGWAIERGGPPTD